MTIKKVPVITKKKKKKVISLPVTLLKIKKRKRTNQQTN